MPHPLCLHGSNSSDGTLDATSSLLLTTTITTTHVSSSCSERGERRERVRASDLDRAEALPAELGEAPRDLRCSGQVEGPKLMDQGPPVVFDLPSTIQSQGVALLPWIPASCVYSRFQPQ